MSVALRSTAMVLSFVLLSCSSAQARPLVSQSATEIPLGNYSDTHLDLLQLGDVLVFDLASNASVDVYLLTDHELQFLYPGRFPDGVVAENVTNLSSVHWTVPQTTRFHLIVENLDSSRPTDAAPTGVVRYDLRIENTGPAEDPAVDLSRSATLLLASIIIVTVALVLGLVLMTRRLRAKFDRRVATRQANLMARLDRIEARLDAKIASAAEE